MGSASPTSPISSRVPGPAWAVLRLALPLALLEVGWLLCWDLARHLEAALLLFAAGFAFLIYAARRLEGASARAGAVILLAAAGLRLLVLPLPPSLSDDALRYLWDGRVVAHGQNPYRLAPGDPELAALRDGSWQQVPHREVPTVYPPLALGFFALASLSPVPLLTWKATVAAADLAGCWALLFLAVRRGVPAGRVVWYAWNPLVVLEGAGMGHVDALGTAAAVAAVALLATGRPARAGLAAAAGALAKLAPLAALPAWAGASRRPWHFLAVALGVTAAAVLPVLAASGGIPPGLRTYGLSWEFNGPVFEPLWRGLDAAGAAPRLHGLLDGAKGWTAHRWDGALNHLYPYLYPQLLAKALLAGGMILVLLRSARGRDAVMATGQLFGGLLLLWSTVYPWYLLWVLPWAALARHPAWLALSGLTLLSYWARVQPAAQWPWIYLGVWLPFFTLLLLTRRGWEAREGTAAHGV